MRVLVVEDDWALCRSVAATLRDEGIAVDTANDGVEGLALGREGIYDAILLDVMMPGLDGWEVLEKLRMESSAPVMMLTARDAVPDRVKGLDIGADDYLTKPFDNAELCARVRALIRRSVGQTQSAITIDKLVLDTAGRTVTYDGKEVELTAREYSILEYLALNRGKVLTRTRLYERLFDERDDSYSNLLDVHVSKLRKKMGPELIKTRRGHGYLIE
tara:strand:- start:17719 stop:18369 length:651 start_codon:yes stop_codon:yes gene_type:complete